MRGFMAEYYNCTLHGEDIVQNYYEAPNVPQVSEEPTSAGHVEGNYPQWDDEQRMDWAQGTVFYAAGPSYFVSSHEGVPDDGTRSCPVDADTSSYITMVNRILPCDHTLPGDYYSTKKLVKDLGLLVEKIHACTNGCMLYWKDDVDLEYCKFCRDGRGCILRGNFQAHDVACHTSDSGGVDVSSIRCRGVEAKLTECIVILQKNRVTFGWTFTQMVLHRTSGCIVACGCENVRPCHGPDFHDAGGIGVDCERPTRLWNGVWVEYREGYGMSGKTKDNMFARRDLKIICNRPELELDERRPNVMPKAVYTLGKEQKSRVCEWIRGLKFLNGYASNLACCVDVMELRMHGMKSHDCHVFM
ncbi:hypothetical protein Sango_1588100 [Sesamum angolense]|uniref:Uncharacterized protein n=1 Tax=Sesamum angolense TaxID=2727404 RepID=A0AAE1WQ92_9LAMI|nr:hypothetical protein Sango_1588100 [Sesamum angolense]